MNHILQKLFASVATLALLASCGGGALGGNEASVRLVNATSDTTSLELFDSSDRVTDATASYAVSDYNGIDSGSYTFSVKSAGVTSTTVTTTLSDEDHYAVVVYRSAGILKTEVLTEEEDRPSSGAAKLRFFNTAAADTGNVDIYLLPNPTTSACSTLGSATATSVAGLQSTYSEVSGGSTYRLCVTAEGDPIDVRLDTTLTFADRQISTVLLTRTAGGVLLNALQLVQQGALTPALTAAVRVRLAVGVGANAPVTVTVGTATLGTNVRAPAVTSYRVVPLTDLSTAVKINTATIAPTGATPSAGNDFTLLATGTGTTATLLADDNSVSTSATRPVKLRLVNGLTAVGEATLTDDFEIVADNVVQSSASAYRQVEASAALAQLNATSGGLDRCESKLVTLTSGKVYSVFLLGDPSATVIPCVLRVDR